MKKTLFTLLLLAPTLLFGQNNYYPSKEQLMLRDNRVKEVITMLHILSETYRMKTAKYEDNIPREIGQYYIRVVIELEKCYRYNLENETTWAQVRDFYIKHKNIIMSW